MLYFLNVWQCSTDGFLIIPHKYRVGSPPLINTTEKFCAITQRFKKFETLA